MIYKSAEIEAKAAVEIGMHMCAAARTAPKARGIDYIETMVLSGEEKDQLAAKLKEMGEQQNIAFYVRDAGNLLQAQALVLIGVKEGKRGLGEGCGYCHFGSCEGCSKAGGTCVFDSMDLGIAIGSAVSVGADLRADTRVMYSIGKAAIAMDLFEGKAQVVMGIPVSISGKSPFFDRK
ncbi:ferredoxin [Anaerostipes sp. 992a]|uniref:ferredoxin domain-containing protein n=1 Tax=Anaerostipes sp. 992a TaxID=1261637 RepID=UPI000953261E|nr:DUF2148 domain-containing protein [Anaerostipes sp. 992a]OLR58138.1 ferredoxin [Anaerostipes sp. 992a]